MATSVSVANTAQACGSTATCQPAAHAFEFVVEVKARDLRPGGVRGVAPITAIR